MSRYASPASANFRMFQMLRHGHPAPRPAQRVPAHETTEAEIRRESKQLFYGNLIHDGHDEQTAFELTIQHFAVADHRAIGALREEE